MANTIQIRRTNIQDRVPQAGTSTSIDYGELAINVNTGGTGPKMYYGNASGATTDITEVIAKATSSVLGKASFATADFSVNSGAVTIAAGGVSNTQLEGSISDSKLNKITAPNKIEVQSLDIDNALAISGGTLATADLIIVDDGATGTNRKATLGNLGTLLAGNGLAVSGATLAVGVDGATIELASDAVRVKDGGITFAKMDVNSVDSDQYVDGSIDEVHISDRAVTSDKIGLQAVVAGLLQTSTSASTGAVTSDKFRPGAVNTAAIGDDQVTNAKIADDAVDTAQIADNAVNADRILDNITLPGNCGSSGNFQVGGNLTVIGGTTTVNSTTVTIDDVVLTLGGDTAPTADPGIDYGVEWRYWDETDAVPAGEAQIGFAGYDDSIERYTILTGASVTSGAYSGTRANLDVGKIYGSRLDLAYGSGSNVFNATIDCGTF